LAKQTRYINCPNCGHNIPIENRTGRKPLNIGVKNICDTLQACRDIALAAEKLYCSRAYIYRELAKQGMKPKEVIDESG